MESCRNPGYQIKSLMIPETERLEERVINYRNQPSKVMIKQGVSLLPLSPLLFPFLCLGSHDKGNRQDPLPNHPFFLTSNTDFVPNP